MKSPATGMDDGARVSTTFGPTRWVSTIRIPDVLASMAGEMMFLANLGAG